MSLSVICREEPLTFSANAARVKLLHSCLKVGTCLILEVAACRL
jgi:hypothetical protein